MSSALPKIAVLLAAYNGMSWIEEQLASILAQTNVRVSVYISVDPSTDGTEAWCAEYARKHPEIHLLAAAGPFKGAARNFFRLVRDVDFSTFDYVSFSDQDDIWYPDKLERAVAKLSSMDIDGYSSNVVAFWSGGRRVLINKAQPQVKWDYLFESAGPGCTYVLKPRLAADFKKLIVEDWEVVQEVALHDWFCYAFARSHSFRWFIDPVPGMDYRQHESNQFGANAGVTSILSRLRSITSGWWFAQVQLMESLNSPTERTVSQCVEPEWRRFLIRVMFHTRQYRRRKRDQAVLALACLVKLLAGLAN